MAQKGFWGSGAVDTPPDLSTLQSEGYPTSGDPAKGIPATKPRAPWYYMIDQMRSTVIAACSMVPKASAEQFLEALQSLKWIKDKSLPSSKLAYDFAPDHLLIRGMALSELKTVTLKDRELAVATDTYELYIGDGVTQGGRLVNGNQITEIQMVLAKLTNAVATLGHQAQPLSGV